MSDEFYGFDDEDFDLDDDDYEPDFDCHLDSNGFCGKAGSEECEWECPFNHHKTTPK